MAPQLETWELSKKLQGQKNKTARNADGFAQASAFQMVRLDVLPDQTTPPEPLAA